MFIKACFEVLEHTHLVPFRGDFICTRVYGFKPIIIDKMILGGQIPGGEVSDKPNVFSMNRRNTNILSPAGSWLPLGNLASSRGESGLQNIYRTSPWMCIAESLSITFGACEDLNGCNSSLRVGGVVV